MCSIVQYFFHGPIGASASVSASVRALGVSVSASKGRSFVKLTLRKATRRGLTFERSNDGRPPSPKKVVRNASGNVSVTLPAPAPQ